MTEHIFELTEHTDSTVFYGVNNSNIQLLKNLHPNLRLMARGHVVKVILETALLTREEKITACQLAREAGAHYVKTSTGFGVDGATVEDVQLMRETVGLEMGVKASGGIRDLETALAMIDAGATKIGTSTGVQIMEDLLNQSTNGK